ncbi:MAG: hypothetical protein KF782_12860 [Labilithrix sp.]|nr:hypothetical protein [Labilithrix sp.]
MPMLIDVYVPSKDGCIYDFIYLGSPSGYDAGAPAFESFVRGFRTLRGPGSSDERRSRSVRRGGLRGDAVRSPEEQGPESRPPMSVGSAQAASRSRAAAARAEALEHLERWRHFLDHLGEVALLTARTTKALFRRPFEIGRRSSSSSRWASA